MKRILLADDDKDIRDMVWTLLSHFGYDVTLARGGEEAVDAYVKASHTGMPFNLVILDLAMPYTNGFEAAQKIRESGDRDTFILFITGYGDKDQVAKDVAGLSRFPVCYKPFEEGVIVQRVQEIIGKGDEEENGNSN